MKYIVIALLLLVSGYVSGQFEDQKFGVISQKEIDMESYPEDPEAGAVVLFDKGKSIFFDYRGAYDIRFTRHKRIKIFDNSELDYAEVAIPFYEDGYDATEKVVSIKAVTYNFENGRVIKQELDPSTVYVERINEKWRRKKFVLPQVKAGSIIEYEYVLETPFHFNLPDWTFQHKIPTIYSGYEVRMIPFYEYVFLAQGIKEFDHKESYVDDRVRQWGDVNKVYGQNVGSGVEFKEYVHKYVMKDVPAFKDESYISSIDDYIMKLDFQLAKFHSPQGSTEEIISTWPELNNDLLDSDHFGKYLKKSKRFAKKILEDELQFATDNPMLKARKIVNYAKNSFKWNGDYDKYAIKSARDFYKTRVGNAAEINLFVIALMREAGIEAEPVILSTRNHGKINANYPFMKFFNYVIILIKGDTPFLTDATESQLPYNRIPPRCINQSGLLVEEDQENWVGLQHDIPASELHQILLTPDPSSGKLKYRVTLQAREYAAYHYRDNYNNDTAELKSYFEDKIGGVQTVMTVNYEKPGKPYVIVIQGERDLEQLAGNLIIKPFLNFNITENKLIQPSRRYPVDFLYPRKELFDVSIAVPAGYALNNSAEPVKISDELVKIDLNYSQQGQLVKANGNYTLKKSLYEPTHYGSLKYFMNQIVDNFNRDLLLEKQSN